MIIGVSALQPAPDESLDVLRQFMPSVSCTVILEVILAENLLILVVIPSRSQEDS